TMAIKVKLLSGVLAFALLSGPAMSSPFDCSVVLSNNLINTKSSSSSEKIIASMQADICSKDFESVQSAREYLRSGGWSLDVFGYFDNALVDRKQTSASAYSVKNSEFCNKSAASFSQTMGSNYLETNGKFVLDSFNKCVRDVSQNIIYMDYRINNSDELQVISGSIHRKVASGSSLDYQLDGIAVLPISDKVSCQVQNSMINVNNGNQDAMRISSTPASFSCIKPSDTVASIDIITSEGSFNIIAPAADDIEREEVITRLQQESANVSVKLTTAEAALTTATQEASRLSTQLTQANQRVAAEAARANTLKGRLDGLRVYSAYYGDGGWQGSSDVRIICPGRVPDKDHTVGKNQCEKHGLVHVGTRYTGSHSGGRCGHTWYAILCRGR
ncbi:MAG: hypothetical protein AAFR02_05270, partial [Pseudomonadota bacterium]